MVNPGGGLLAIMASSHAQIHAECIKASMSWYNNFYKTNASTPTVKACLSPRPFQLARFCSFRANLLNF